MPAIQVMLELAGYAPGLATIDQDQIEAPIAQTILQRTAQPDLDVENRVGKFRRERTDHTAQLREVLRHTEAHSGSWDFTTHAPHRLIAEVQNALGIVQQCLALPRQRNRAVRAVKQHMPDHLFQPLELKTDRWLAAAKPAPRLGKAASARDRCEGPEKADVKLA